jgi:hypothetical protein
VAAQSVPFRGHKVKLMLGNHEHREIVKKLVREVYGKVIGIPEEEAELRKATAKKFADKFVKRELSAIADKFRAEEKRNEMPVQERRFGQTREERMTEHERKMAEREAAQVPEPGPVQAAAKDQAAKPVSRSTLYREMRELKADSPAVFDFVMGNRRTRTMKIPGPAVQDMVSKLLISRLSRRAVGAAIDARFEEAFPPEATPALVYMLTSLEDLARRPDTLKRIVRSRFGKGIRGIEFVQPVTEFLLHNGIIEAHHSKKGRGVRIAIARRFGQ